MSELFTCESIEACYHDTDEIHLNRFDQAVLATEQISLVRRRPHGFVVGNTYRVSFEATPCPASI